MPDSQRVLVTGGTGYVGSHTVVELLSAGHDVFVVDNLSNSKASVLDRVGRIAGRRPGFAQVDIRDRSALAKVLGSMRFDSVVHFAGRKAVGESVAKPLEYFDNNVSGSLALFECMAGAGVKSIVFSSSATVYGDPATVPIREDFSLAATNPYARTKIMIEDILRDLARSDPQWRIALLRYFNPVGAHPSGLIGEDPNGIPNNLMPYVAQVAMRKLNELPIFGDDYATPDGTGVRDFVHVVDLAHGHVAALRVLESHDVLTVNLGTGRGFSVRELVRAFETASGRSIPCRIVARRPGDVAQSYADPSRASRLLGWRAERGIDAMCADAWRWQCWATENLAQDE